MNPITAFQFQESRQVRVIIIDGEPWFIAADVCSVLEIRNSRDALARLDEDEKGVAITDTLGGPQEMTTINESGVYSLTFTSRKPEAKKFKKWVTSEVLPAIRKTGKYVTSEARRAEAEELFNSHDQNNLTRLVWLAQNSFRFSKAVNAAIWHRLRTVTGVPSPQKMRVADLAIIAAELRLIFAITRAVADLIAKAEEMMVRRILRHGENAEKVVAEIEALLAQTKSEQLVEANNILSKWHEREVADLVARKPNSFFGYPEAQESLKFN